MILSVLNQKGGVGKTTIAMNLAMAFSQMDGGTSTLLIDADTQKSSLNWSGARKVSTFPVVGCAKENLHLELPHLIKGFDHVIIDGPPHADEVSVSCIAAAEIVLIPVEPSALDIWASANIVKLVTDAKKYKTDMQIAFMVNRVVVNTLIGRDVADALKRYKGIPTLKTVIHSRVIFGECPGQGTFVLEKDPTGPASQEIRALAHEIMEIKQHEQEKLLSVKA